MKYMFKNVLYGNSRKEKEIFMYKNQREKSKLSYPCCTTALCHLSVLPMVVHICQCYSLFLKGAMEATY